MRMARMKDIAAGCVGAATAAALAGPPVACSEPRPRKAVEANATAPSTVADKRSSSIARAVMTPGRSEPRAAVASDRPRRMRSWAGLSMTA